MSEQQKNNLPPNTDNFDESGSAFAFFCLSLLTLYLVPATISRVWSLFAGNAQDAEAAAAEQKTKKSKNKEAEEKPKSSWPIRHIVFVVAWLIFIALLYTATSSTPTAPERWNPYTILGLGESATPEEIKKAYRAQSLKWHPDKNKDNVEEAETRIVDINKAYEVLTDEEARKIWERTGSPDDTREMTMGVALPRWMVRKENTYFMLFLYMCLLLAIVSAVYYVMTTIRKSNVEEGSAENKVSLQRDMYEKNKALFQRHQRKPPQPGDKPEKLAQVSDIEIVHFIAKSPEFLAPNQLKEIPGVDDAFYNQVAKGMINFPKPPPNAVPAYKKAVVLLYAHLHRIPIPFELVEDYNKVVTKAFKLLRTIVDLEQFSRFPGYFTTVQATLKVHQNMVQGLWERNIRDKANLLQLPFVDEDVLANCISRPKKDKDKVRTINKLLEKQDSDRRAIFSKLDDAQYGKLMELAYQIPTLEITQTDLFIKDEEHTNVTEFHSGDVLTLLVVCDLHTGKREKIEPVVVPVVVPTTTTPAKGGKGGKGNNSKDSPKPASPAASSPGVATEGAAASASPSPKSADKDDGAIVDRKKLQASLVDNLPKEDFPVATSFVQPSPDPTFWIFIVDTPNDRVVDFRELKSVQRTADNKLIVQAEFKLPTSPSLKPIVLHFAAHVFCDSYIGLDVSKDFELRLKPTATNTGKVNYVDDEEEEEEATPVASKPHQAAKSSQQQQQAQGPAKFERVQEVESDEED